MAEFTPLPTDYVDDILSSSNTRRKYQQTDNPDGTKSFTDVTEYDQEGTDFGAVDVNRTNKAINNIYSERILTFEEVEMVTETGFFVDAQVINEFNNKIKSSQLFSESDEVETGETWVDGKKIYRRTFITINIIPSNDALRIPISFEHSDIWIDQSNSFIKNNIWTYPIPLNRYSTSDESYIGIWIDQSNIILFSGSGWNESWTKVVTVRYTKP